MITCPDLARLADDMGVLLTRHDSGPKGFYDDATRTISTRRGLPIAQYKSTLAHELAHAHYRDVPTGSRLYDLRQERRADKWAARLLLQDVDLALVLTEHSGHLAPAAHDLEITVRLLKIHLTQLEKSNHV